MRRSNPHPHPRPNPIPFPSPNPNPNPSPNPDPNPNPNTNPNPNPNTNPKQEQHAPLNALADALRRQQRWPEATQALRAALALRPADPSSQVNLGAALLKQARPREAEAHFRAAVRGSAGRGVGAAGDAVAANAARGLEASLGMRAETGRGYEARRRGRTKRAPPRDSAS